jgi:hypothetical protein
LNHHIYAKLTPPEQLAATNRAISQCEEKLTQLYVDEDIDPSLKDDEKHAGQLRGETLCLNILKSERERLEAEYARRN